MGKTVTFLAEASALGECGFFISARDFLTFDLDVIPDLSGKTLFIDGLDEVRSGLDDPRGPF
ncbi:MAG: hypothetical protein OXL33_04070, partial [Chloroflexota bacterium]|nr:hypothetical protein [Chloroflexota bacterium]